MQTWFACVSDFSVLQRFSDACEYRDAVQLLKPVSAWQPRSGNDKTRVLHVCLWLYAHIFCCCCCCNFVCHVSRSRNLQQFAERIKLDDAWRRQTDVCCCEGFYLSCMSCIPDSLFILIFCQRIKLSVVFRHADAARQNVETCSVFLLKHVWAWAATRVTWLVCELHKPSILTRCCVLYVYVVNVLFVDRPKCRYF